MTEGPKAPSLVGVMGVSLALAMALGGALTYVRYGAVPEEPLPVYHTLPTFALQDQTGARFGTEDLAGHVVVANFIFTSCTEICPIFTRQMAEVQTATEDLGDAVLLVSFSVDPEVDTPEVLAAYAQAHGAGPLWHFLTGPNAAIESLVVEGFKQYMERDPAEPGNVLHGSHFVLLDRQGRVRAFVDARDETAAEAVARDARRLAAE